MSVKIENPNQSCARCGHAKHRHHGGKGRCLCRPYESTLKGKDGRCVCLKFLHLEREKAALLGSQNTGPHLGELK